MLLILPILALFVITTVNPIQSVINLVILSTILAVFLFNIGITFLSLLYIAVYVGAVAILFVFVIIILDIRDLEIKETKIDYIKHIPFILIIIFITLILFNDFNHFYIFEDINSINYLEESSIESIAKALYGFNIIHFLITALILLASIIGPLLLLL